jgi:hypothetical protein
MTDERERRERSRPCITSDSRGSRSADHAGRIYQSGFKKYAISTAAHAASAGDAVLGQADRRTDQNPNLRTNLRWRRHPSLLSSTSKKATLPRARPL